MDKLPLSVVKYQIYEYDGSVHGRETVVNSIAMLLWDLILADTCDDLILRITSSEEDADKVASAIDALDNCVGIDARGKLYMVRPEDIEVVLITRHGEETTDDLLSAMYYHLPMVAVDDFSMEIQRRSGVKIIDNM